ncbi:MAG: TonB-dependent receptor [Muribaculaceae bacterium]|nr:TonB-dependent receptor [Muribaculaceae bacterium]
MNTWIRLRMAIALAACSMTPIVMGAGYTVKGRIFTTQGSGIDNAVFELKNDTLSLCDSTDTAGMYLINDIPAGEYSVSVAAQGFISFSKQITIDKNIEAYNVCLRPNQNQSLSVADEQTATQLDEVEVLADALQTYGDRDEMYLSSYNCKYGVNALDAISSLPRFIPQINGHELLNEQQDVVNILINGRPGTSQEVRNLKGSDIVKVIYYTNAPAKYAGIYGGAVANIIVKKPKELELSGNLNAFSALLAAQTSDGASFTLRTPSTYINADYAFFYSDRTDLERSTCYDYGALRDSYSSLDPHIRTLSNNASLSWQYDTGGHTLYAKFKYSGSTSRQGIDYTLLESTRTSEIEGTRNDRSHQVSDRFSLDLYYSYLFSGGQQLMINAVGTTSKNSNDDTRTQTTPPESAYSSYLYSSLISARVNSLIGDITFTSPLWGGEASASVWAYHRHIHQNYSNNFFPDLPNINLSDDNNLLASADYSRSFGPLYAALNLSFSDYITRDASEKIHHQFSFLPRLNLSYLLSKAVTLRFLGNVSCTTYGTASQNLNRQLIDTYYFKENIPYRENTDKYTAIFSADIKLCTGRLLLSPSISYDYIKNYYINYIYREADYFLQRPYLVPDVHSFDYTFSAMWMPIEGLQLRPIVRGSYRDIKIPGGNSRHFDNHALLYGSYMFGQFQISGNLQTPRYTHDGISTSYHGWSGGIEIYWIRDNLYAGLSYHYNGDTLWNSMEVPGFTQRTQSINKAFRYWIGMSIGFNFHSGSLRHSATRQKSLNHAETETGL